MDLRYADAARNPGGRAGQLKREDPTSPGSRGLAQVAYLTGGSLVLKTIFQDPSGILTT